MYHIDLLYLRWGTLVFTQIQVLWVHYQEPIKALL